MHSYALNLLLRDVTAGAGLKEQFAFGNNAAGGQSTLLSGRTAHSGTCSQHEAPFPHSQPQSSTKFVHLVCREIRSRPQRNMVDQRNRYVKQRLSKTDSDTTLHAVSRTLIDNLFDAGCLYRQHQQRCWYQGCYVAQRISMSMQNSKLRLHRNLQQQLAASPQTWLVHLYLAAVPCRPCVIVVCS